MTDKISKSLRLLLATSMMAFAGNSFLKYLWWTACYSAWYGIPKLAEQWKAAGSRASFNLWSVIALDFCSVALLLSLLRSPSSERSGLLRNVPRLILSFIITIVGTGAFALALAWLKQGAP